MNNKINIPIEDSKESVSAFFDKTFTYLSDVKRVFGKKMIFHDRNSDELKPIVSLSEMPMPLNIEVFDQVEEACDIISIDSSCISIGETEDGTVYAVKSGVSVYNSSKPKSFHIYGPYLVYLDEQVIRQIYRDNPFKEKLVKLVTLDNEYAKDLVRVIIEREVQRYMATKFENSIILVDGSLKPSLFEVEGCSLSEVMDISKERGNTFLGVSKRSKFKLIKKILTHLELLNYAPVKVDVHHILDNLVTKLEGHIFVVKFKRHGYAFRVDVPYDSLLHVDVLLGKVLWNDGFKHGYPESLIMAHSVSIFNAVEQVSIKSALARSLNIVQIPTRKLRRSILGGLKFEGGLTNI
ncbi:MAG: DNA double-strand break repair nuclease NurA [Nitrososphaeria archaeon]